MAKGTSKCSRQYALISHLNILATFRNPTVHYVAVSLSNPQIENLFMNHTSRRKFIGDTAKAAAGIGLISLTSNCNTDMGETKNVFIHHVYFWLNNPGSEEDRKKLIEGLTKLTKVKTIKSFHIGKPAGTNRDVIDSSYAVSWLLFFDNAADQESYQKDPIHLKFVDECKHLWQKVIVYDSIDA